MDGSNGYIESYYDYDNAIAVNINLITTDFTADNDGLFIFEPFATSGNYYDVWIKVNNSVEFKVGIASGCANAVSLPLKKGDVVKYSRGTYSGAYLYWIPKKNV